MDGRLGSKETFVGCTTRLFYEGKKTCLSTKGRDPKTGVTKEGPYGKRAELDVFIGWTDRGKGGLRLREDRVDSNYSEKEETWGYRNPKRQHS